MSLNHSVGSLWVCFHLYRNTPARRCSQGKKKTKQKNHGKFGAFKQIHSFPSFTLKQTNKESLTSAPYCC